MSNDKHPLNLTLINFVPHQRLRFVSAQCHLNSKLKAQTNFLLLSSNSRIQFVRNTNDLHADGESSLRRITPVVFAVFYYPRVGSVVVDAFIDRYRESSKTIDESIDKNEITSLSLFLRRVLILNDPWLMCLFVLLFFLSRCESPRSLPTTIDRSIDHDRHGSSLTIATDHDLTVSSEPSRLRPLFRIYSL